MGVNVNSILIYGWYCSGNEIFEILSKGRDEDWYDEDGWNGFNSSRFELIVDRYESSFNYLGCVLNLVSDYSSERFDVVDSIDLEYWGRELRKRLSVEEYEYMVERYGRPRLLLGQYND